MQTARTTRRLARVRVVNIKRPIELFELAAMPSDDWSERCRRYDEALAALESNDLKAAAGLASALSMGFPEDLAVAALNKRIAEAALESDAGKTAIWRLPGK